MASIGDTDSLCVITLVVCYYLSRCQSAAAREFRHSSSSLSSAWCGALENPCGLLGSPALYIVANATQNFLDLHQVASKKISQIRDRDKEFPNSSVN